MTQAERDSADQDYQARKDDLAVHQRRLGGGADVRARLRTARALNPPCLRYGGCRLRGHGDMTGSPNRESPSAPAGPVKTPKRGELIRSSGAMEEVL